MTKMVSVAGGPSAHRTTNRDGIAPASMRDEMKDSREGVLSASFKRGSIMIKCADFVEQGCRVSTNHTTRASKTNGHLEKYGARRIG